MPALLTNISADLYFLLTYFSKELKLDALDTSATKWSCDKFLETSLIT